MALAETSLVEERDEYMNGIVPPESPTPSPSDLSERIPPVVPTVTGSKPTAPMFVPMGDGERTVTRGVEASSTTIPVKLAPVPAVLEVSIAIERTLEPTAAPLPRSSMSERPTHAAAGVEAAQVTSSEHVAPVPARPAHAGPIQWIRTSPSPYLTFA